MNSVVDIIEAHGYDSAQDMEMGDHIKVEVDGFEDLSIEKILENKLSVMQTYTQRGDLMRDPEIVFDVSGDEWVAIELRMDPHTHMIDDNGVDEDGFTELWNKNLRDQGFVDAARDGS